MLQSATDHKTYQQRNLTILPGSFAPTENGPVIAVAILGARRSPKPQLTDGLPSFKKDRIQLQQVILNLIMNAVEAMSGTSEGPRELLISARKEGPSGRLVVLQDSGPDGTRTVLTASSLRLYDQARRVGAWDCSICRSIVEAHGGRVWISRSAGPGATVQFTLPVASAV